jgi:hypothetical protein
LSDGKVWKRALPIRLIETEADVAVFAVAFRGPDGLAPEPPAGRVRVVWL